MKRESLLGLMVSGAIVLAGAASSAMAQEALTEPQLRANWRCRVTPGSTT